MPSVRFLIFKYLAHRSKLVVVILLFNKIIPTYSCCMKKGLVYITIVALFGCQPSSCFKYIKLNMHLSYNIYFISNTKCIYLVIHFYTF
jgi:hypothetical protein